MPKYAVVEKNIGETPLMALRAYRARHPELSHIPMTYAGRLDPMASGKLLLLIGEECKKKESYLGLDKEYEFEVLLGCSSDTGDVLGLVNERAYSEVDEIDIQKVTTSSVRTWTFPYPAYSSKTHNGTPLFQHAHEGTLETQAIPTLTARIYRAEFTGSELVSAEDLLGRVTEKLQSLNIESNTGTVSPDFRRDHVLARWRDALSESEEPLQVLHFIVIASSGTYIRTLASHIANDLGTCGLALSIHRTRIGRYLPIIAGCGMWRKQF